MTFDQWMRSTGLAEATVEHYLTAIQGSISQWANEAALMDGSITAIYSLATYRQLKAAITDLEIFRQRDRQGNRMYTSALNKYEQYLQQAFFDYDLERDLDDILADENVTEKSAVLKTRIGQGSFRQKLIDLWDGCAVTGYRDTSMLVASHIKPWSHSSDRERLDPHNGLLLLPSLDKAFDRGFVSFTETGEIMVSVQLEDPPALGIQNNMWLNMRNEHRRYMQYHRMHVFRGA